MRKLLALLIFSLLPALAAGQYSAAPIQRCTLDADLKGDAPFYLQYGRDSWTGQATVFCNIPSYRSQRTMAVTFNSSEPGFGAGPESIIHLKMNLLTTTQLTELRVFSPVAAATTAPTDTTTVAWVIESESLQANITVSTANTAFSPSLQRGTLLIW